MSHERDELPAELADLLGAAWQEHRAPDASPTLAESDAETRASVQWMQQNWARLETHFATSSATSAVDVPTALRRRFAQRHAPVLQWRRHLAAAALLLSLGLALRFGADWGSPALLDRTQAGAADSAPLDPARPRLVATHADHIELRSGPVRLLLLTSNESPPLQTDPTFGSDYR